MEKKDERASLPFFGIPALSEYLKSVFRMYGSGETVEVDLLCDVSTMKAVIDQFGKDVKTQQLLSF